MRVLYLSYTGLLEPLGQSQVLGYLRQLARAHDISLVTFEKLENLAKIDEVSALEADCRSAGIKWTYKVYHQRPRILATAWDILQLCGVVLWRVLTCKPDLIHCRSYIPAFVACGFRFFGGPPYIFDTRALWLEEMIAANRLQRNSLLHKLLSLAERATMRRGSGIVSLTNAAIPHMRTIAGAKPDDPRFVMIPTCADVKRFGSVARERAGDNPIIVGCLGTVMSGWFKLDWLEAFFAAVHRALPDARFKLITRDDPVVVRAGLCDWGGKAEERLEIFSVDPDSVPNAIRQITIGVFFFDNSIAKLASSPTRLGELLAAGIPVVANAGTGDVNEILTRYQVGVLVADSSAGSMDRAVQEVQSLRADPDLGRRCRQAAEEWFSLEAGVRNYNALYRQIGLV